MMLNLEKKTISGIRKIAREDLVIEPFLQKLYAAIPPKPVENRKQYHKYMSILEHCLAILQEENLPARFLKSVRHYAETLSLLIGFYEKEQFRFSKPSQAEVLKFLMEQHSLTQADLAADMGGQPAVSNVLNGKRKLNIRQIENLSRRFHVNPSAFFKL